MKFMTISRVTKVTSACETSIIATIGNGPIYNACGSYNTKLQQCSDRITAGPKTNSSFFICYMI